MAARWAPVRAVVAEATKEALHLVRVWGGAVGAEHAERVLGVAALRTQTTTTQGEALDSLNCEVNAQGGLQTGQFDVAVNGRGNELTYVELDQRVWSHGISAVCAGHIDEACARADGAKGFSQPSDELEVGE